MLLSSVGWKAERGRVLVVVKCQLKESERHHGDNDEPLGGSETTHHCSCTLGRSPRQQHITKMEREGVDEG